MSDSRAEPDAPRVLKNKWRLDRVIGAGGMAVVYEATHRNGMRAAVKMLRRELSWEPELRGRFLREGYLANTVGHPGVPQVFDDDIDEDGSVFLVMELLVGETAEAARRNAGGKMAVGEAVRIGIDTLDVLVAAHDKGVVHRDIKPDNLFINTDGHLKVLDFGIARVRAAQGTQTQTGSLLGTPAYMSPEQARGHWEDVDARTDVWAVGATLFTLLTGQFVHTGRTGAEALVEAVTKPARTLASVAPEVPEELCAIIDRALVFSRDERWPSARAMQEALIAFRRRTDPQAMAIVATVATAAPAGAAGPQPTPAPASAARSQPSGSSPAAVDSAEARADTAFPAGPATAPGRRAGPATAPQAAEPAPEGDEDLFSTAAARRASSGRGLVLGGAGAVVVIAALVLALRGRPAPPPVTTVAPPAPVIAAPTAPAPAPVPPAPGPPPVSASPIAPAHPSRTPSAAAAAPGPVNANQRPAPRPVGASPHPAPRSTRPAAPAAPHHAAAPAPARPRPSTGGTAAPRPAHPDVDLHDSRR